LCDIQSSFVYLILLRYKAKTVFPEQLYIRCDSLGPPCQFYIHTLLTSLWFVQLYLITCTYVSVITINTIIQHTLKASFTDAVSSLTSVYWYMYVSRSIIKDVIWSHISITRIWPVGVCDKINIFEHLNSVHSYMHARGCGWIYAYVYTESHAH
jgi:hypothetical protein